MLTRHISLEEMIHSDAAARLGIDNTPDATARENLNKIASVIEVIRVRLCCPVSIHSGYRSTIVNAAIGGVGTSAHCKGLACDFAAPEYGSEFDVAKDVSQWIVELGIDQLIREYGWVHVGLRDGEPRHELLTKRSAAARYELGILA